MRHLGYFAAVGCLLPASVLATGFEMFESRTVRTLGTAGASAMTTDEPGIMDRNPAGLAMRNRREISVGAIYLRSSGDVEVDGANTLVPPPAGVPIAGNDGKNPGKDGILPALYGSFPLNDRVVLGAALNVPFGLANSYDRDWVGRYQALDTELLSAGAAGSIAYRVNPDLAIGASVGVVWAEANRSVALDLSTFCLAAAAANPALAPACAATGYTTPGNRARDGKAEVDGDDFGFQYSMSVQWNATDRTTLALGYRGPTHLELEGSSDFDLPGDFPLAGAPAFTNGDVKIDLTLPESATLGVAYRITNDTTLHGTAHWTRWSRLDELAVEFVETGAPTDRGVFNFHNAWTFAAGAEHRFNERLTLRGGIAYHESPVKSRWRNFLIPDNERFQLAIGATYRFGKSSALDIGVSRAWVRTPDIDHTGMTSAVRAEVKDAHIDQVGVQLTVAF